MQIYADLKTAYNGLKSYIPYPDREKIKSILRDLKNKNADLADAEEIREILLKYAPSSLYNNGRKYTQEALKIIKQIL